MLTNTDIEKYFNAEKSDSLLFIIIGITAIVLALIFIFYVRANWSRGASIPLLVIGLMHLAIGTIIFNRSDKDRIRVVYALSMNPGEIAGKEIPRMELVNKNFVTYRYIEIVVLLIGLGLVLFFKARPDKRFWLGVGVALAIEAVVSLGADFFAEKRAATYTHQLKSLEF